MYKKINEIKSKLRLDINRSLLAVTFTIFVLIISLNPSLFKESIWMLLQLVIAIPLLLSSMFARSNLATAKKPKLWEKYGYFTFLISYSFLINVIAILISMVIGLAIGLIFLGLNVIVSITYSIIATREDKTKIISRIKKDLLFIAILLFGGVLPSIGFY
jgi:hypothetical protein